MTPAAACCARSGAAAACSRRRPAAQGRPALLPPTAELPRRPRRRASVRAAAAGAADAQQQPPQQQQQPAQQPQAPPSAAPPPPPPPPAAFTQPAPGQASHTQDLYSSSAQPITKFGFATGFGDKYELGEQLGSGTFGIVHVAVNRETGERCVWVLLLLACCPLARCLLLALPGRGPTAAIRSTPARSPVAPGRGPPRPRRPARAAAPLPLTVAHPCTRHGPPLPPFSFAVKSMPKRFASGGATLEAYYVRRVRNEVDICNHLGRCAPGRGRRGVPGSVAAAHAPRLPAAFGPHPRPHCPPHTLQLPQRLLPV